MGLTCEEEEEGRRQREMGEGRSGRKGGRNEGGKIRTNNEELSVCVGVCVY